MLSFLKSLKEAWIKSSLNSPVFIHAFAFLIETMVIVVLPGPTYYAGFLFMLVIILYVVYEDLSVALFHLYLLSTLIGRPVLRLKEIAHQDFTFFELPILVSQPIEIPIRSVVFFLFLISLLRIMLKPALRRLRKQSLSRFPLVTIGLIVLIMALAQILANYRLVYTFPFFQIIQIFLVFPATTYFLLQKYPDWRRLRLATRIFIGFVFFSLFTQGTLATVQYTIQSPTNIRIEAPFEVERVRAPEDGLFRSPGTLWHPNYLGVNVGILLPVALGYALAVKSSKKIKSKLIAKSIYVAAGLGLVALLLSFSRWAWISFVAAAFFAASLKRGYLECQIRRFLKKRKFRREYFLLVFILLATLSLTAPRFRSFITLEGRLGVIKAYTAIIKQNPVWGVGPGNSMIDLSPYRESLEEYLASIRGVHNTFLLFAAENGLFALCLFLIFIISIFKLGIVNYRTLLKNPLAFSFAISMLVFLFNSLAYPLYTFDPSLELFFLLAAIFYVMLNSRYQKRDINLIGFKKEEK